ncbi:DUF4430 domain-containing protein [Conexibacter sp. CPCC 206217]|uniref:DUF4430 domain-containing protein n=1 Tax=Conexibacter sp. CPCC 206217 TaxID=3064574 RepID=UPI00271E06EB|nr:DUF4430 domain-containing protein [Conexibacter sp. CPCC 206217]MDO8212193.1 DUF4430 domain-containing protein [Conexibacter sp. CPCC 206217]
MTRISSSTSMVWRAPLACVAALLCALPAAGCGLGAGSGGGDATIVVTEDFGARVLGSHVDRDVPESETALRATERNFDVKTSYGGRFVDSIDGVAGSGRRDWFFFVDGSVGDKSAADVQLQNDAHVWWDYRDWSGSQNVDAVVGQYPAPFAGDADGAAREVAVRCAPGADVRPLCDTVARSLTAAGASAAVQPLSAAAPTGSPSVLVGPWRALRADAAVRELDSGPARSGVFARFDASGERLDLLDPSGDVAETAAAGAGLVAAVEHRGEPVWVVTGTDAAGVTGAADALDAERLRAHFALAVLSGKGDVALPAAR